MGDNYVVGEKMAGNGPKMSNSKLCHFHFQSLFSYVLSKEGLQYVITYLTGDK